MSAFRIAVLASGGGTNLQAILDKLHGDEIQVVGVASDVEAALERDHGPEEIWVVQRQVEGEEPPDGAAHEGGPIELERVAFGPLGLRGLEV